MAEAGGPRNDDADRHVVSLRRLSTPPSARRRRPLSSNEMADIGAVYVAGHKTRRSEATRPTDESLQPAWLVHQPIKVGRRGNGVFCGAVERSHQFPFFSLMHFLNRTRPPPTGSIDWGVVVVGPLNDSNMLLKERGRRWKVAPRRATESFRISVSLMSLPVRSDSCANRPISFRPVPDAADQSFIRDSLRARFTFLFDYLSTVPDNILIDSNKKKVCGFRILILHEFHLT